MTGGLFANRGAEQAIDLLAYSAYSVRLRFSFLGTETVFCPPFDSILDMQRLWAPGSGLVNPRQATANLWRAVGNAW